MLMAALRPCYRARGAGATRSSMEPSSRPQAAERRKDTSWRLRVPQLTKNRSNLQGALLGLAFRSIVAGRAVVAGVLGGATGGIVKRRMKEEGLVR